MLFGYFHFRQLSLITNSVIFSDKGESIYLFLTENKQTYLNTSFFLVMARILSPKLPKSLRYYFRILSATRGLDLPLLFLKTNITCRTQYFLLRNLDL